MEVKVYLNQKNWREKKSILCRRVDCPDVFDFADCIKVMRSLFGNECIIEFVVV